jgi:DNA-binding NarL/FixJ family response regulator
VSMGRDLILQSSYHTSEVIRLNKIRVLIVDDHNVVRDGLQTLIETRTSDIEVAGTAVNGQEALDFIAKDEPDLVLMDLRLPQMNGVEATQFICQKYPKIKVLILTSYNEETFVVDGMRAGANGYLLKDVSWSELEDAIRTVNKGGVLMTQEVAQILANQSGKYPQKKHDDTSEEDRLSDAILSAKEKEVLKLLAQGLDNKAIAKLMFLSEGTIRNYVSHIYELIGVHDRAQAVVWAIRHHLMNDNMV